VGVCVNLAVELNLQHLDEEHTQPNICLGFTEQEERRGAWWATWELDTYGAMLLLRPFTIDRRCLSVMLPISDQAWYVQTPVTSVVIQSHEGIDWVSLRTSATQSPRAWFLAANHILSQVYDQLFLKRRRLPQSTNASRMRLDV
jgi:hypothetical protein